MIVTKTTRISSTGTYLNDDGTKAKYDAAIGYHTKAEKWIFFIRFYNFETSRFADRSFRSPADTFEEALKLLAKHTPKER